jgi:hypothetical protein
MTATDDWSTTGANILSPELLARVRGLLELQPIILEQRSYGGGSAPSPMIFEHYEDFLRHLRTHARRGDQFLIWGYYDLCRDDTSLVDARYPDDRGRTPRGALTDDA